MRALILCLFVGAVAARVQVSVKNKWGNGMEGEFSIKVNKPYNGWKATITFSTNVQDLEIWEAAKSWCSGNTCEITNLGWNANLNPGDTLSMNFVARFSGHDGNPWAHIVLQGNGGEVVTDRPVGQTTSKVVNPGNGKEKYNYNEILEKSILFYEAQRSGRLPANNRIPWRGNSALQDRGNGGEDLTGGWYDAGDNVKFGFPMAWTTTTLVWGLIEYKDAYQAAGQLDWMYESVKWPLDYFVKAHTKKYEFYGQCGNGHEDHASWVRPESMNQNRPAYKVTSGNPGSELTGETAAALAAGSIAFKTKNPTYSALLLKHAKELFDFANKYRGKYTSPIPDAQSFYGSTNYEDELVWAAAWLYRATKDNTYLNFAKAAYKSGVAWAYSWDEKKAGYQLLMYQMTKDNGYKNDVQAFLDSWMPNGGITYTPKGLAWRDAWGSLRYSANSAFIALVAADQGLKPGTYRQFAMRQINYMLGDTGRSYVVGFGNNPPTRPHHRAASCPNASCGFNYLNTWNPNPHVLQGALVGGPDRNDNYVDDRNNHQTNEVATDYNAGFQGAVAGLKHLSLTGQLPG